MRSSTASAPAEVLDLGCGTGRPFAEEILARGHRVTGVDQSEALLAIARTRYRDRPAATWIASTIESFESARTFDAVVCWDAIFHIDRAWHERLFARFAALLRPGGRFMLTFGGSAQPAFTDTMFGATFAYDSHPPETELALLARAGFVKAAAMSVEPIPAAKAPSAP